MYISRNSDSWHHLNVATDYVAKDILTEEQYILYCTCTV